MGRGKEILLKENDKYLIKYGTIDSKEPTSVFLTISSWVRPKDNELNYDRIISKLRKKIKQKIYNNQENNIFNPNRTIVDLDLRSSGISTNKKSFMFCEITLFQRKNLPIKSEPIVKYFEKISDYLMTDVFDSDSIFEFSKTKNGGV